MKVEFSRWELNSAIQKLLSEEEFNEEAARMIVEFGHQLKKPQPLSGEYESFSCDSGSSLTGFTQETGNETVSFEGKKHKEGSFGKTKERIGYYKVYKMTDGKIAFHHFWASDLATSIEESDQPDKYVLVYDKKTLAPLRLGVEELREKPVFTIPIPLYFAHLEISFSFNYLRIIKGDKIGKKTLRGCTILVSGRNKPK